MPILKKNHDQIRRRHEWYRFSTESEKGQTIIPSVQGGHGGRGNSRDNTIYSMASTNKDYRGG